MNPGQLLGPYRIEGPLGAGGMGEVYLAEDTRLGRKVAIKVLPEQFAGDPERLARFAQEARAAAALNNPHIAVIHDIGFEPAAGGAAAGEPADGPGGGATGGAAAGAAGGGTHYMVQEYLEGRTLREALDRKALPLHQALALAVEIGEALAAAHAAGIVHRDLKPGNVFVTESGHAKVLDFGLAKLTEALPGSPELSMSPTVLGTVAGQVMGTAGYMAPEQVNGDEIDARADVFAFGCILYEMVTGKRAFAGETLVDTLHAVTRTEPISLRQLDAALPGELQRIQRKCIAKDRTRRYQHVADLVVDLNALRLEVETGTESGGVVSGGVAGAPAGGAGAAGAATAGAQGATAGGARAGWLGRAALVWALAATAFAIYYALPEPPPPSSPVARFSLPLNTRANFSGLSTVAISRDGRRIVFRDDGERGSQLWVRDLDSLELTPIADTTGALMPFFSPDGESLGYVTGTQLKVVDLESGSISTLAEIEPDALRGAAWGDDGTIVLGSSDTRGFSGLRRLNRATSSFDELTQVEGELESHRFPELLPDGRILFTRETAENNARADKIIAVLSPASGEITSLDMRGTHARWVPSGHLLYIRNDVLVAQPFDLATLQTTGQEVIIARDLAIDPDVGNAQYAVSDNGILVFQTDFGAETRLALVDRGGAVELLHDDPKMLRFPRMSPDGTQISVSITEGQIEDVWLFELQRRTFDRLTGLTGPTAASWSPDGSRLAFESPHEGSWKPYVEPADGVGGPQAIEIGNTTVYDAPLWHRDGETIVYGSSGDIYRVPVTGGDPVALTDTPFLEGMVSLSPDGDWMAFSSEEQGREQVYVTPFPGPGRRWVASTDGGNEPVFSRDGSEIFYRRGADMMSVSFDPSAEPPFSRPERLFTLTSPVGAWTVQNYDVTDDGQFVMLVPDVRETEVPEIVVVMDWLGGIGRPGGQSR